MKIAIEALRDAGAPTQLDFQGDSAWWRSSLPEQPGVPREVAEPFHIRLRAHRMGEDVYIEGELGGAFSLECSRCLARYRHALREPLRLVLEPIGTRMPADPEAAGALLRDGLCVGDELEAGWFRGSEIDLAAVFREVVSSALPVKPLCREDCAGLCSRCGKDLNVGPCGCPPERPDSPFAVLASLRVPQERK